MLILLHCYDSYDAYYDYHDCLIYAYQLVLMIHGYSHDYFHDYFFYH